LDDTTSDSKQPLTVSDNRPEHRFVLDADGRAGELTYQVDGDRLVLRHTEVDDSLRGQGAGGRLVRAALVRATDDGLTVVPRCPYARRWLREHPDVAGTETIDWRTARPDNQP
jgi:predicted GNAT family acetyltransferase